MYLPLALEDRVLKAQKRQHEDLQRYVGQYRSQPQLARNLADWADRAPRLPRGVLLAFAKANVAPSSGLGKWAVKNASLALDNQRNLKNANSRAREQLGGEGSDVLKLLSDQSRVGQIAQFDPQAQERAIGTNVGELADYDPGQLERLGEGRDPTPEPGGIGGIFHDIGDVATTGARTSFAGLQAPYEAGQAAFRGGVAGIAGGVAGAPQRSLGGAAGRQSVQAPTRVGPLEVSPTADVFDPHQVTLYNMITGDDAGHGWLPAGEALAHQQQASRDVASIVLPDGTRSALTPGRGLAALVTEPGTRPYQAISGLTDLAAAIYLDPANLALGKTSEIREARKLFTPEAAGAYTGLRKFVHGPTFTQWADSRVGTKVFEHIAGTTEIRKLRRQLGDEFPAELLAPLQDATDPTAVRNILEPAITGGGVRNVVDWGFDWKRPWQDIRWASQMPHGAFDPDDVGNNLEQMERLLVTGKVPGEDIERIMSSVARVPKGDHAALFDVVVHKANDVLVKTATQEYGVDFAEAKNLFRSFEGDWKDMQRTAIDKMGDDIQIRPPAVFGEESFPVLGPHLENELLNRAIPLPDAREIRRQLSALRPVLNNGLVKGSTTFADWFMQDMWKPAALLRGAWTVRVIGEEQIRMAAAGLDSMFHNPISWIAYATRKKGDVDALGQTWDDILRDAGNIDNEYAQGLSKRGQGRVSVGVERDARTFFGDWTQFTRASPGYNRSWADEISQLHLSPTGREVARSIRRGPVQTDVVARVTGREETGRAVRRLSSEADPYAGIPEDHVRLFRGEGSTTDRPLRSGEGLREDSYFTYDAEYAKRFAGDDGEIMYIDVPRSAVERERNFQLDLATEGPEYQQRIDDVMRAQRESPERLREFESPHSGVSMLTRTREFSQPLDDVKQMFWDGSLAQTRERLRTAKLWDGRSETLLATREGSDAYIDSVWERMRAKTADDPELLDVIADGKMLSGNKIDKQLTRKLSRMEAEGVGPEEVKGRKTLVLDKSNAQKASAILDRTVQAAFTALMTIPTNRLSRSPAFRQYYWKRVEELLPYMDDATQTSLLRVARNSKIKLAKPKVVGELALEQADTVAKSYALDKTRDLLYDVSERSHGMDALRIVFPFGEAWKEVLGRWAKLAYTEPRVIRRAQQGIQGARGNGFFYTDPDDGQEYFTFPFSEELTKRVTGAPFPMRGRVAGLNLVGQGIPGVGPVFQIPASHLIPQEPKWDVIRDFISPYGDPETSSGVLEAFMPGWLQKMRAGGWLEPVIGPSAEQSRIYENVVKDSMKYLAKPGAYDLTDPDGLAKLESDARSMTRKLYPWRSAVQFVAPTAPQYVPQVEAKDGRVYEIYTVAKDYQRMLAKNDGDWAAATKAFVDRYGATAYMLLEPSGRRQIYGAPTTRQTEVWRQEHKEFAGKYREVAGYFAPQGGDRDYDAYLRSIARGDIEPLNAGEWLLMANDRVASALYQTYRAKLPANPARNQLDWLARKKKELIDQFEGYDPQGETTRASRPRQIQQLTEAVRQDEVKDTPLAQASRIYLQLRDKALAGAAQIKKVDPAAATLEGKKVAHLRAWLREMGDGIIADHPEFTSVWDGILFSEVDFTRDELEEAA